MRKNESEIQQHCVRWFRYAYPKLALNLFAVPNGGFRYNREAERMKREGVIAGVSDLILLVENEFHNGLCIEMKYGKNKQTDKQKEWEKAVSFHGYKYVICRSVDEFRKEVDDYLYLMNSKDKVKD